MAVPALETAVRAALDTLVFQTNALYDTVKTLNDSQAEVNSKETQIHTERLKRREKQCAELEQEVNKLKQEVQEQALKLKDLETAKLIAEARDHARRHEDSFKPADEVRGHGRKERTGSLTQTSSSMGHLPSEPRRLSLGALPGRTAPGQLAVIGGATKQRFEKTELEYDQVAAGSEFQGADSALALRQREIKSDCIDESSEMTSNIRSSSPLDPRLRDRPFHGTGGLSKRPPNDSSGQLGERLRRDESIDNADSLSQKPSTRSSPSPLDSCRQSLIDNIMDTQTTTLKRKHSVVDPERDCLRRKAVCVNCLIQNRWCDGTSQCSSCRHNNVQCIHRLCPQGLSCRNPKCPGLHPGQWDETDPQW